MVLNLSEPSMDLYLYGSKAGVLTNYIANQLAQLPPTLNDFSQRIHNSLTSSYNFLTDRLTQYGLMNQIQSQGIQVLDNQFMELMSFTALQNADLTMQRWIMSHPDVRQLYVDQNLDGYSDTYRNVFGKDVGEQDYNYRLVMDGVLQDADDHWVIKHHIDDLLPGDKELDHYEKVKVLHTFDTIDRILSTCNFDFTHKSEEPTKINRN